ncbi:uncharacterized protein LOC108004288 isoform X1 [Apis cerana]|uniref:uncharacterized protein LOC108004288 isoform X1 n=2 Tax=Apis cerana TaxID=7461 RepID=UPI0007E2BADB|nr:uncharacterized protein LOC108004288 isoform X1 [Apis cerana]
MAISASFHRNVLLLTQVIQPNNEFKKYFREGMFDKPNTAGFLHISYYLLTVYDSERFKKLIEWPVICKKTEAKYRNNVKDYLTIISAENLDIDFPPILTSHLIHAGGTKFTIIMWKLSEVVIRRYLIRETNNNIAFAPRIGNKGNLAKKFLEETNAKINFNILNQHKNLLEMENTIKYVLQKENERLNKSRAEIFEKEQLITNLPQTAPVHPSIKKCLRDIDNEEATKKWKMHINKCINHIQKRNVILKDIEQLGHKINNIILSNTNDIKMLNTKQKINHLEISELFSPDMQCLLFRLYKDDKLILNNFILLFHFLLIQLKKRLKLNILEDFSEYSLQVEGSCKDIKAAFNIMQTHLIDITKIMLETQDILYQKKIYDHNDTILPMMHNVLIMSSPLIKINTNCNDEENNFQKRLQLTPVEAPHKSLFSRYEHLKQSHVSDGSKLRENLLVSRINFDDVIVNINNDKPSLHMHMLSSKKNFSSFKQAEKYSRLFSTRIKRNMIVAAANTSIMSLSCSSKANSTTIANAIEEIHDISDLNLNKSEVISTKNICNIKVEFATPEKLTIEQEKSEDILEMEDMINDFSNKANAHNIYKTVEIKGDDNNIIVTDQTKQNRRSIGDLVERYKKLLKVSNRTPSPNINNTKCDNK